MVIIIKFVCAEDVAVVTLTTSFGEIENVLNADLLEVQKYFYINSKNQTSKIIPMSVALFAESQVLT